MWEFILKITRDGIKNIVECIKKGAEGPLKHERKKRNMFLKAFAFSQEADHPL